MMHSSMNSLKSEKKDLATDAKNVRAGAEADL